jgi:hypothetical protein
MAIRSIKTGLLSRSALVGNSYYIPPGFESIVTATPTSGSSVTINSIPGTYAHLQLRIMLPGSSSNLYAQFNNDTTSANYPAHIMTGTGAAVSASGNAAYGGVRLLESTPSNSSFVGVAVADILDYSLTTKNKTVRAIYGWDENGSGRSALQSSLWMSTSAITRIDLFTSGTFLSGTHIALYGIKAA